MFALLNDLLQIQRSMVSIGQQLILVLDAEEQAALDGFKLSELQSVIAQKDQIIHRFLSQETKRRQLVAKLAFLIGLDTRNLVPTLSTIVESLRVYARGLVQVLKGDALKNSEHQISTYVAETMDHIPHFAVFARRIQRNKTIMTRLLNHVNKSLRFFEAASKAVDSSYDKGGKVVSTARRSKENSILRVKA